MATIWSETIVDALKALAADGLSASQAAAHFNGMTRSAAIGLAFRRKFHFLGQGGGAHNEPKNRPHVRSTPFITVVGNEVVAQPDGKTAGTPPPLKPLSLRDLQRLALEQVAATAV